VLRKEHDVNWFCGFHFEARLICKICNRSETEFLWSCFRKQVDVMQMVKHHTLHALFTAPSELHVQDDTKISYTLFEELTLSRETESQ
jgi:mRNA-degrading endonuclease YafQ of YafQ-DinJ toxin-antitoxin module